MQPQPPGRVFPVQHSGLRHLAHETAAASSPAIPAGAVVLWPLPGELGFKLRRRYQALDARTAARTLAVAGLLSLNRATVVPWALGKLVAALPASERAQFAAYLNPLGIQVAYILAALFLAMAFIAAARPLWASVAALSVFVAVSIPFVWQNPVLVGGGNIGRIVMFLLLMRALCAGIAFRMR